MDEEKTAASSPHLGGCFFCDTALPMLEQFWPETTRQHFRNSRLEFLKGIRSLIDDRIDHLSRAAGGEKGTHVVVE